MLASSSGTHVVSRLVVGLGNLSSLALLCCRCLPGLFSQLLPLSMINVGLGELSLQLVFEAFARRPTVTLALAKFAL